MNFCESYLRKYYDNFKFFDIDCNDKRVREVNMRIKRCHRCKGFNECRMHPDFWLDGDRERFEENERLEAIEAASESEE